MTTTPNNEVLVNIEDEMRSSYMEYAMSVIVARALPDVRDGLKPVHRRILFAMNEMKNFWNQPYKKSARVVGDVMGKYHPHGDSAIYDTLVRMAQPFSMRYTLVDGQGNFGSVDGDPAAAMRYTEVRLDRIAGEMLADIDKETVDFGPNYDNKEQEPLVLPTRLPNLLVNGTAGIAVGMATNIPPHNLREVVDAVIAMIHNPSIGDEELMTIVPGPDFPTGAFIDGREGIRQAYTTGRGVIRMRAKALVEINPRNNHESIVIYEIPYQLNKVKLLEKIADLIKEKKLEGIRDLRDESDRDGMRVVIDLKKDAVSHVVLNQLYKMTPLQSSFGINMVALADGIPRLMTLRQILGYFIDHRRDVVTRRTNYDLRKAQEREHILEGLKIALDNLDEVISTIRASKNPPEAKAALMEKFSLSELQSQAILDMRLQRLTGLERDKILQELEEIRVLIKQLKEILESETRLLEVVVQELTDLREKYGDNRRTVITDTTKELEIEDMIVEEDVVVTVSNSGYIKRSPVSLYRAQHRGTRGKTAVGTKEEDFVAELYTAGTHDYLLVFSNKGMMYWLKVHLIPEGSRGSRGKAIVNLVNMEPGDSVKAVLPVKEFKEGQFVIFATRGGTVKKTDLAAYSNVRNMGIRAIVLDEGDELVDVRITDGNKDVLLSTAHGKAIRFPEKSLRPMGRVSRGVRGITIAPEDRLVSMEVLSEGATLLTVTENGFGKRTSTDEYRLQGRGGRGIITIKTTMRNGNVIAVTQVLDDDEVMITTDHGILLRMKVKQISVIGRNTQGVRLINLDSGNKVAGVARLVDRSEESGKEVVPVEDGQQLLELPFDAEDEEPEDDLPPDDENLDEDIPEDESEE